MVYDTSAMFSVGFFTQETQRARDLKYVGISI